MQDTLAANINAASPANINARLVACTFRNLLAMATELNGNKPLGFDPNRGPGGSWQGKELKPQMAAHMLGRFTVADILALLPKYEQASARARAYVANNPKHKPRPVSDIPQPQPVPMPADPTQEAAQTQTQADEGATVKRVREIAREEASALDAAVTKYVREYLAGAAEGIAERHNALAADVEALRKATGVIINVHNAAGKVTSTVKLGRQHFKFDKLLKRAALRDHKGCAYNIWLTGPAGSGKTTAAENVALALSLPFHFSGAVDNEYKLMGFINAAGVCIRTAFREAYEHGGVFLLDEVDGCHAGALLALNAALANGYCDFPDAKVKRHPDCVIMAAANTWGTGATHDYIGRSKLDAASLDRFIMMEWPYDEDLERDTCGNPAWARKVQGLRKAAAQAGVKHVISPRASYVGAVMLAAGFDEAEIMADVIFKGLSAEHIKSINNAARS